MVCCLLPLTFVRSGGGLSCANVIYSSLLLKSAGGSAGVCSSAGIGSAAVCGSNSLPTTWQLSLVSADTPYTLSVVAREVLLLNTL